MKTWLIDQAASRTRFDAAIENGLVEFSNLSCAGRRRELRIGVANDQGVIYREILASNAQEWVAATTLMASLGLQDERHDFSQSGYLAVFKAPCCEAASRSANTA